MRYLLAGILLMASSHAVLATQTVEDKFLSALEKVAPPRGTLQNTGKFKALCVCVGTGVASVGVIESLPGAAVQATCMLPMFAADGSVLASAFCGAWVPLTKP